MCCPISVFITVSNLRTSIEWLSTTAVVKPRQPIQRVSASIVFLSTTFSGKTASFISLHETKLTPPPWFCWSTDDQQLRKTPAVQRTSGCFYVWRYRATIPAKFLLDYCNHTSPSSPSSSHLASLIIISTKQYDNYQITYHKMNYFLSTMDWSV